MSSEISRPGDVAFSPNSHIYREIRKERALQPIKLSCVFRRQGQPEVFGLVPRALNHDVVEGTKIVDGFHQSIGEICSFASKFRGADSESISALFCLAVFNSTMSEQADRKLRPAVCTQNFYRNIFGGGTVRARKLPPEPELLPSPHRSNSTIPHKGNGYLTGDITGPQVRTRGSIVEFSRLGVARAKHHREFAKNGDGGTPVISRSRALLGFIVAKEGKSAFVLPAEHLAETFDLEFLVPPLSPVRSESMEKLKEKAPIQSVYSEALKAEM